MCYIYRLVTFSRRFQFGTFSHIVISIFTYNLCYVQLEISKILKKVANISFRGCTGVIQFTAEQFVMQRLWTAGSDTIILYSAQQWKWGSVLQKLPLASLDVSLQDQAHHYTPQYTIVSAYKGCPPEYRYTLKLRAVNTKKNQKTD